LFTAALEKLNKPMQRIVILLIRTYQYLVSPVLGNHCRFYPSCSCYAVDALQQHGIAKGLYLSVRRISRCHPWHEGGYDPVPDKTNNNN
jgi:putative membrane protein insertion efficiency factor